MRVIDGMHRLRAAKMRGDETISTRFFEGDDREAFLLSVEANIRHGLPLSRADREAAARRILVLYWQWSDRAVAAVAGLSPTTVSAIRGRLDLPAEHESRRMGRDGRVRPRDGSAGRRRAGAAIARRPDAPLRAIAEEAGVSVGTARDVRARLRAGQDPVPATARVAAGDGGTSLDGGSEPPRRRTAGRTVDWPSVRGNLSKDPSVKYAESGRALVRWLNTHVIEHGGLSDVAGAVPAHWRGSVAELARSCAEGWLALAQELEDGT
ncbi:ParB/RepB/Spo0J family partition protein [Dactylosporangium sp. NBC_01737]|uniref:ParB/RepB/Spo0J family partition protein n=1 Tax=Dactylosporangium sp. NBC_01737 TaxID=2975959 RepID=UPI002E115C3E|nr:ParB/RepB/Spo0J family partition protein [Dactylosporangium sp. NBC_01737]